MANKEDLIIEGYYFGSFDDAKQAKREIKNAQYLNERVDVMNLKQKLALYNKMLDEKVFSTPVGWEYLKYLRGLLLEEGIIEEELRPIPLYITFTSKNDENEYSHIAKLHVKPGKSELEKTKNNYKISLIFNILFVLLIIAMFAITMNSTTPNIINYKTVIVDQYSSWEQDLRQREEAVKEKEKQLNINSTEKMYEDISG